MLSKMGDALITVIAAGAAGVVLTLGENRSFGFDLGYNTSSVMSLTPFMREKEYIERPNLEIVLSCYPDLKQPLPTSMKHLISQKYPSLELQSPNYLFGIEVSERFPILYDKINMLITLPQLLSKSLSYLNGLPHVPKGKKRTGCGIGIPMYFTDSQRTIIIDDAKNAGLDNPALLHEATASALSLSYDEETSYRRFEKTYVIVDMGVTSMQVCIAQYTSVKYKNNLEVLSQAFDYSVGGRAFDEVLYNHFNGGLREFGFDAMKDLDFHWKLYSACEKMKIDLSSQDETSFEICWNDTEMVRSMKRADYEKMCDPLLERVKRLLEKALSDAGLCAANIHSVENVGLASQIPAIIKILTDIFGRQPNQVDQKNQRVAEGCCLIGNDMRQLIDKFPHSIAMSWNTNKVTIDGEAIVFPSGSHMNTTKEVPFSACATFYVDFMYVNMSDSRGIPISIGRFKIGSFQSSTCEKIPGKFSVKLDTNGIISVETAFISENEIEVRLEVSRINESQVVLAEAETSAETSNTNQLIQKRLSTEAYEVQQTFRELDWLGQGELPERVSPHEETIPEDNVFSDEKNVTETVLVGYEKLHENFLLNDDSNSQKKEETRNISSVQLSPATAEISCYEYGGSEPSVVGGFVFYDCED